MPGRVEQHPPRLTRQAASLTSQEAEAPSFLGLGGTVEVLGPRSRVPRSRRNPAAPPRTVPDRRPDPAAASPCARGRLLRANPKPFFGVSDNTNLGIFLWNLGIVSYYGGTVMTDLGRPGAMHPDTAESLRAALFTHDEYRLRPAGTYTDVNKDWRKPDSLLHEPEMTPGEGWSWHGPQRMVSGPSWGGSLEIVDWHLRAHRYLREPEAYTGAVLFLETCEEMPDAEYVYRVLSGMAERGMLRRFAAMLIGRPKAWALNRQTTPRERADYRAAQRDAVLRAHAEYHPDVPLVFDVDLGHVDPHLTVATGGVMTVDPATRTITTRY